MTLKGNIRVGIFSTFFFMYCMFSFVFEALSQDKVVEHETGFYYTIQKGDTLWDLSQRFSDSPWQWPDLWSKNPQITNPHEIYPGQRIQLFLKKGIDMLSAQKTDAASEIPEWMGSEEKPGVYFYYSRINELGFIRPKPVEASGEILEAEANKAMISVNDVVYIKHLANNNFVEGQEFVIYQTRPPLTDPETNGIIGTPHLLTGIVTIIGNKDAYAIGKVTKSIRLIELGQLIMPYEPKKREIPITESPVGISGKIVFSEQETELLGADHIIFIDKGNLDGVQPGQMYTLFVQKEKEINSATGEKILLAPIELGKLIVLLTEETASTCLITQSKVEIPLYANFGTILP
jgi:hypothetical protein